MKTFIDLRKETWQAQHSASFKSKSMYYYVRSAGHFYCNNKYYINREKLNEILLVITLNGKGYLKYRNQSYELTKNKGFIIDCSEYQQYYTDKTYLWEFIWLHFTGCQSKSYVQEILNHSSPIFEDTENIIKNKLLKIHNLLKEKTLKIDIISSKLIVDILTHLILTSYNTNPTQDNIPKIVNKAICYFESNYSKKITLDNLCKKIGISKSYLIRQFKYYTGYSPYEYLLKYRLNEAKTLLIHSDITINELSYMVGFESASHFIKYFTKNEGLTPLEFRKYWKLNKN